MRQLAVLTIMLTSIALADDRPNILLIVADDLGYADLAAYGGDIDTPAIDALARNGVLFTQFHTAPMCSPTRAMLLSGNNNHVAGIGRQRGEILDPPLSTLRENMPGYEGHLSERIAPLPRLLHEAGYHTYTVGKWHLGVEADSSPYAAGFERAFNLLQGAANHWDSRGFHEGGSVYRLDQDPVSWPDGRYSTDLYTERLIEFIGSNKDDGRPFFALAAYTSPHWPLQVPDDYLDLYSGRYDDGYDALREQRFESLKRAEIIPALSELPPRNDSVTPWHELNPEQQRRESRKMELYASMVDNLDDHVGRLLDYLRENDLYDNTLVVFMSDNGAASEDFYNRGGYMEYVRAHYDNAYDKMGRPESFVSYSTPWAEAGSAPFRRHKGYTREGGIVAPLMIAGAGVAANGKLDSSYLTVMDLAPTFLDIAGAQYPDDGSVRPMLGESIRPLLSGTTNRVHDDDYVTAMYHGGRAMLRQGRWKLSTLQSPFDPDAFELFDVIADPGETNDLAEENPEKYQELITIWNTKRSNLGILLPGDI